METQQIYTVTNDWLQTQQINYASATVTGNVNNVSPSFNVSYWPNYIVPWTNSWRPNIQLKLSEIDVLRKVASKDSTLKEILNKITQHIEVLVDF